MFDLFSTYNNENRTQVHKRMFKFIGVTKKHGDEDSNILKNSWIALHIKRLSARQWCDAMMLRDTPGDEIALYILYKLYH